MKKAGLTVRETVNASKEPHRKSEALALAHEASTVIAGRGKKWQKFVMRDEPADADLLKQMLGPTGKLRAPTIVVGKTVLAGFCKPAWEEFFG
jgi:arsenate reductase-like glutaredoxin family protein